jgi:hypothetical protein
MSQEGRARDGRPRPWLRRELALLLLAALLLGGISQSLLVLVLLALLLGRGRLSGGTCRWSRLRKDAA